MRWWLVGAWLFAAVMCGVVLWRDAHFVMRCEVPDERIATTFGCFEMESVDSTRDVIPLNRPVVRSYADVAGGIRNNTPDAERGRVVYWRLSRAGTALYVLAWAAPVLGLLAFLCLRGSPAFRHVLLLLGGLAPLAALEYFRFAVSELRDLSLFPRFMPRFTLAATSATWWARVAWGLFLVAAAISWWRTPRPREVAAVDPEVFE